MKAPVLTTDRVRIEPVSLDHWEDYAVAWADPKMTEFIGGKPRDRTTSWAKFIGAAGLWPVVGYGYWSFVDRETGTYLGCGGLSKFERGIKQLENYPETGWALVPDAWGKGYATEVMGRIFAWADEALDSPEIRCIIDAGNGASVAVAKKLGFQYLDDAALGEDTVQVYVRPPAR